MNVLELGSCRGDTTFILSQLFNNVISYEQSNENLKHAHELNKDNNNVKLIQSDVYSDDFELPDNIQIAFLDAGHTAEHLRYDIERVIKKYGDIILIFDDFGQSDKVLRNCIKKAQDDNLLSIDRYIGQNAGFVTANGKKFITAEGVICNLK